MQLHLAVLTVLLAISVALKHGRQVINRTLASDEGPTALTVDARAAGARRSAIRERRESEGRYAAPPMSLAKPQTATDGKDGEDEEGLEESDAVPGVNARWLRWGPKEVRVAIRINELVAVKPGDNKYQIDYWMICQWNAPPEHHDKKPRINLANELQTKTVTQRITWVGDEGTWIKRMRSVVVQDLDLTMFPFDDHMLRLIIEAGWRGQTLLPLYEESGLQDRQCPRGDHTKNKQCLLGEKQAYIIRGWNLVSEPFDEGTPGNDLDLKFSRLVFTLDVFHDRWGGIQRFVYPIVLIIICSFCPLFLPIYQLMPRVMMNFVSLLTVHTIASGVGTPTITTWVGLLNAHAKLIVFVGLLETTWCEWIMHTRSTILGKKLDWISRWVFPIIWIFDLVTLTFVTVDNISLLFVVTVSVSMFAMVASIIWLKYLEYNLVWVVLANLRTKIHYKPWDVELDDNEVNLVWQQIKPGDVVYVTMEQVISAVEGILKCKIQERNLASVEKIFAELPETSLRPSNTMLFDDWAEHHLRVIKAIFRA